jgi:hypothetical protein
MGTRLRRSRIFGFSLVELLIAMALAVGLTVPMLQLLVQARQVFHDQSLVLEMRQTARAVAARIADDIRRAGQGVPLHAASWAAGTSGSEGVFLEGTGADALRLRLGPAVADGLAAPRPMTFRLGESADLVLREPAGRYLPDEHLFLWGRSDASWTWVRARVVAFDARSRRLDLLPVATSPEGGALTSPPVLAPEDAVSYRRVGDSIRRGELMDFSSPEPRFRESSVGEGFTRLTFLYYAADGSAVSPDSPEERARILRVEVHIEARTAAPLANGGYQSYRIKFPAVPLNVQVAMGWL